MKLTEDISKKYDIKRECSKTKKLKKEEEELDEINVTANMDGGEGPPKTPHAFVKRTKDTEDGGGNGEVLGYTNVDKTLQRKNFKESTYKKIMGELHEISYPDYKKDDSMSNQHKVNHAITEINKRLYEIERIANQNVRLKTEVGITPINFWKPTKAKLHKISERMLKISKMLRELNS